MSNAFLDVAAQDKNEKGSYELTSIGVFCALVVATAWTVFTFPELIALPFVVGLAVLAACVRFLHKRSPLTLLTPNLEINWGRLAWGAGVWVLLLTISAIVEGGQFPERYTLTNTVGAWSFPLLLAICLIPLQAASVELYFRGYLLQWLGLRWRQPLVLCALSGLLYAMPHYIEAVYRYGLVPWPLLTGYFIFGVGLAALTLRTQSAELAVGLHTGHNLFLALGVHSSEALVYTPALFRITAGESWYQLGAMIVALLVVWVLVERQCAPQPVQAGVAVPESLTK